MFQLWKFFFFNLYKNLKISLIVCLLRLEAESVCFPYSLGRNSVHFSLYSSHFFVASECMKCAFFPHSLFLPLLLSVVFQARQPKRVSRPFAIFCLVVCVDPATQWAFSNRTSVCFGAGRPHVHSSGRYHETSPLTCRRHGSTSQ